MKCWFGPRFHMVVTVAQPTRADWAVVTRPMAMSRGAFCAHSRTSYFLFFSTRFFSASPTMCFRSHGRGPWLP